MRFAAVLLLLVSAASAQNSQPSVSNARFENRTYAGDLASQIRASSATWFGYAVKSASRIEDDRCERCRLEEPSKHSASGATTTRPIALEGTRVAAVLFRVEHDTVEKIRLNSLDCPLDAGGLPFIWVTGVPASASLSFLQNLVDAGNSETVRHSAVFAISQHDGPEAITVLENLARPPQQAHVRSEAIFWLAQRAGERAASIIVGAIENDPDTEVKERAVFALSQLPKDEGVPRLIEVARQNKNREVRKRAFFWLGQSQDPRALAYIEQVLER
jgi:hypothetical protein